MRKTGLLLAGVMLLAAGLFAQASDAGEQARVRKGLTNVFDALSTLDMAGVRKYSTPDLLLLENGVVWNLDSLAVRVNPLKGTTFSRVNHLDYIQTTVSGNMAWVAYDNKAEISVNGKKISKHWLESVVMVKEGNDWKLRMLHSTVIDIKGN